MVFAVEVSLRVKTVNEERFIDIYRR